MGLLSKNILKAVPPLFLVGLVFLVIRLPNTQPYANLESFLNSVGNLVCVYIVPILIGISIILRLIPQNTSTQLSSDEEADFNFWRTALIVGIIFWFIFLPIFMLYSLGGHSGKNIESFINDLIFYSYFLVPLISLTCLFSYNKKNLKQAVFILKIPFYYGIGVYLTGVAVLVLIDLLSR